MSKDLIILGSTGSIGHSTLLALKKNNKIKIKLLTTNKNVKKILKQAIFFKVKDVIVEDVKEYKKYRKIFKEKKINLYHGIHNINRIVKKKVTFCINAITGLNGLQPTIKAIPLCKNILIANKESIICAWDLILKKLKIYKTNFIPLDSEHFSIWKLIKNEPNEDIEKIILTASGGPFLNKSIRQLPNISPKKALKHPNWKMGKKISIDSATMMNKVFEFIEAKKIFNIKKQNLSILVHPSSFIHAIVFFKGNLIKFLGHETNMIIPISNALGINKKKKFSSYNSILYKINNLRFFKPNQKKFPLLGLLKLLPNSSSYFETVLITLNDELVNKYLNKEINYVSIQKNIVRLINNAYFKKYYKLKPNNINDIINVANKTKNYLNKYIIHYVK